MSEVKQHGFTEAPASWNIKFRLNGLEEQLTLRGESYAEIQPTIDKARAYVKGLVGVEHTPKATDEKPPAPESTTTTQQPAQTNGALSFEVDRMEASVEAGKVSWRCKGGHFTKYGVICWPEVIKAANMNLDAAKGSYTFNPPLMADYVMKDDGKPQKVTRLYQKAA